MTTLGTIKRHAGMAGQFSMSVTVGYPDEEPTSMQFVGSVYGGPVVMVCGERQTFVTEPGRFGSFAERPHEWVRRFCGQGEE